MRFNAMFLLLILSCLCVALAQTTFEDCCLRYAMDRRERIQRHAVKYRDQWVDGGCNIPAVIFTLRKGRKLCTNPREKWVQDLKKKIDKRRPYPKKNKNSHPVYRN